jgi:hypothetical protein
MFTGLCICLKIDMMERECKKLGFGVHQKQGPNPAGEPRGACAAAALLVLGHAARALLERPRPAAARGRWRGTRREVAAADWPGASSYTCRVAWRSSNPRRVRPRRTYGETRGEYQRTMGIGAWRWLSSAVHLAAWVNYFDWPGWIIKVVIVPAVTFPKMVWYSSTTLPVYRDSRGRWRRKAHCRDGPLWTGNGPM